MSDTIKILLIAGAAGFAGYWYCTSKGRKNPDEEMEALLTDRLKSLDSGGESQQQRMNPHGKIKEEGDLDYRLRYLESAIARMQKDQRLSRRLREEFDDED